jgi:hypothetical protein
MTERASHIFLFATCITFVLLISVSSLSYGEENVKRTGTFSDLAYHSESGDLVGVEIRIIYSASGYQAMIQIAQGEAGCLVLIPVSYDNSRVKFQIPDSHVYAGSFEGEIGPSNLKGVLRFKTGAEMKVDLERKRSYWD